MNRRRTRGWTSASLLMLSALACGAPEPESPSVETETVESQVAQADTPRPLNAFSEGKPRYRADAPVAAMRASAV